MSCNERHTFSLLVMISIIYVHFNYGLSKWKEVEDRSMECLSCYKREIYLVRRGNLSVHHREFAWSQNKLTVSTILYDEGFTIRPIHRLNSVFCIFSMIKNISRKLFSDYRWALSSLDYGIFTRNSGNVEGPSSRQ